MTWNYRLFKQDAPQSAGTGYFYFVGECYYDDTGKPELHSMMDHNLVCGDSSSEAEETYNSLGEAFNAPVIELDKDGNFKR